MKALREFRKLLKVNKRLLNPKGGCQWDLQQTHQSLRPYLLEETCETIDAINDGDSQHIAEELGDVLYQVIFHAQVAERNKTFNLADICFGIRTKLIRRHPHVFHKRENITPQQVMRNWNAIKINEKKDTHQSTLSGVPVSLPALQQAEKYQRKAAACGFDWSDINGPLKKLKEEVREFTAEVKKKRRNRKRMESEFGDILFALVNIARFYNIHPEMALRSTNRKFFRRFRYIEKQFLKSGQTMRNASLSVMERYWKEAKKKNL